MSVVQKLDGYYEKLRWSLVKKMDMAHVYDIKFNLTVLFSISVFSGVMNLFYSWTVIRYGIIVLYAAVMLFAVIKYRDQIAQVIFKNKSKKRPEASS